MNRLKKSKHAKKIYLGAAAVVIGLAAIYGGGTYHYNHAHKFLPNTFIDQTEVGGKTASQAEAAIKKHLKKQTINLTKKGKTVTKVQLKDTGVDSIDNASLKSAIKKQHGAKWPLMAMKMVKADLSKKINLDKKGQSKLDTYSKSTADEINTAALQNDIHNVYNVTSQVDSELLADALQTGAQKGTKKLDLKSTYPTKATRRAQLKKKKAKILTEKAVYVISGTKVKISKKTIRNWLEVNNDKLTVNKDKIKSYLDDLNDKYSTNGAKTTFNSTKRGKQTVKNDTLGWSIMTKTDAAKIADCILAGQDFNLDATTSGSGTDLKKGELGSTYIEVDKTNQHMWYYKDGKQVISTDVVTGKPSDGNTTPTGVFFIWDKQQNATLRGKNDDGSKYASPVNYWMPIDYTGVGIHDADWQPTFGGTWYKTHGSHGCVNTPPSVMKQLFAQVSAGTPVIVF